MTTFVPAILWCMIELSIILFAVHTYFGMTLVCIVASTFALLTAYILVLLYTAVIVYTVATPSATAIVSASASATAPRMGPFGQLLPFCEGIYCGICITSCMDTSFIKTLTAEKLAL